MLQNLAYFMYKKTQVVLFIFLFSFHELMLAFIRKNSKMPEMKNEKTTLHSRLDKKTDY